MYHDPTLARRAAKDRIGRVTAFGFVDKTSAHTPHAGSTVYG